MENSGSQSPGINQSNDLQNRKGPLAGMSPLLFIFVSLSLVFFLYQIAGGIISYFLLGEDMTLSSSNLELTRVILMFAQFMFILAPSVFLVMLQDNNIKQTFRLYKPKLSVFVLAVFGILVIQPFLQLYVYFQNELIFSLPFGQEFIKQIKELLEMLESATEKLVTAHSFPEFIVILLVIAVTPAICEEFLFRGLVLRNFEKIVPAAGAIFFSGALFALFHFHPFNLVPLVILGVFLSMIVYHSGSIYTAVVCHFLNNLISATAVYIFGTESLSGEKIPKDELISFSILGIISFLIFLVIIFLIKKNSVINDRQAADLSQDTSLQKNYPDE